MISRKLLAGAAALLSLSLVTGCGGGGSQSASAKTEIELWFWGVNPQQRQIFEESLVKPYNESQDAFELKATFNEKVDSNIQTALAANKGPDIVYGSGPAFVTPYAQSNKLLDLTKYSEQYGWKDKILDPIYQSGTVDGKLYAVANAINTIGVFYNASVLEDLGVKPPETIDDLTSILNLARSQGMYPSVTGNKGWQPVNENYTSLFLTHILGPKDYYNLLTGEISWTDPKVVKAVETSKEWYENGNLGGGQYLNLNFTESMSLLAQKKSPFFFGPTLAFQFAGEYFNDAAGNTDDLKFVPFPNFSNDLPSPLYTLSTTASFSINANSKNPDEAAKIIDMMMQNEFAVNMTAQWPGYWASPLKDLDLSQSNMTGLSKEYANAISQVIPAINEGKFGYFSGAFFPPETRKKLIDVESVWLGETSTDHFLADVQTIFDKELAEGGTPPVPQP